jgi:hypothetical protein
MSSDRHTPQSTAARRAHFMPDWPRAMDAELAAAYCSVSPNTLRKEGPKPVIIGKERKVWLRHQLDTWLDGLAGIAPPSAKTGEWDD